VLRYKKEYTWNEWNNFDRNFVKKVGGKKYVLNMQEYLCKKYDVTITNYKTPRQRQNESITKKIDKVFSVIDKMFSGIDKCFDGLDKALNHIDKVSDTISNEKSNKKLKDMGF